MAGIREIARDYKDEIMDGIAWVAIWKTGRAWNARAFWLDGEDKIGVDEIDDAQSIVAEDPNAVFINKYECAHMGEGTLEDIVAGIRFHYGNGYNKLVSWLDKGSASETIVVEIKSNGYKAEGIQSMIERFNKAATQLFPGCTVHHFYYGNALDMADVVLESGWYAHFNVTAKRVSLGGYTCSDEDLEKFGSMTHNDRLYNGKLLEIVAKEGDGYMKVFYTFGTDDRFPFCGGWVEVEAPTMKEAHVVFREHYPDREPGILNCSDYYTEEQFNKSDMPVTGNRGAFCHCKLAT